MKKYILTNSFHRTEATVLVDEDQMNESQRDVWHTIESSAYEERYWPRYIGPAEMKRRRVWRKLCGIKGCCCGTVRK